MPKQKITGDSIEDAHQEVRGASEPVQQKIAGRRVRGVTQVAIGPTQPTPPPATALPSAPLEVRLTCLATTDGVRIIWEAGLIGQRVSRFVPPFVAADLELVLRALDLLQYPDSGFTGTEEARLAALGIPLLNATTARVVGQQLYQALTADPQAAQALGTLRDAAAHQGLALSLHLHLPTHEPGLLGLPWELLWHPHEPTPLLLSRGQAHHLTRHLDLAQASPAPHPPTDPLRLLAIAPQANLDPAMHAAEEAARLDAWRPLLDQGRVVLLPTLSPATRVALSETLRRVGRVDVLHYIGHGGLREQGVLLLDSPAGRLDPTPISQLAPLLAQAQVRLVVLTACQSGMVRQQVAPVGVLSGVAPALIAQGVPAVVAMQHTVRQQDANRATRIIYEQLVAGVSLAAAVAAARMALYTEAPDGVAWYVPTLYVGPQPSVVQ
ncbi:CHAT domain-containing protein [Candidatus Oscillochloris fontis]|uniref:CHAT domain-containing protein n=1 Tax=Candidatus Oscillochloris fontis TaxID=2496868 RepID=UPI00101C2FB3|nr:CHAT domain-containing protein [Candidatus Oscillochloris fontis]